jgi:hypothetical protein
MNGFGKNQRYWNFTHAKNMPIKFTKIFSFFSKAPIGHEIHKGERRMT